MKWAKLLLTWLEKFSSVGKYVGVKNEEPSLALPHALPSA